MRKFDKEILQNTLNNEADIIKKLKALYSQCLKDLEAKTLDLQSSISQLQGLYDNVTEDKELEKLKSMVQSKVYQKQYQEALKGQIEAILRELQVNEFTTISEYLNKCYEDGFFAVLYSLQQQGIPLILPINQEEIIQAVALDSKISQGLYTRLGEDVKELKKKIAAEISRGVATNTSYHIVANNLKNITNIGYNNAIRISRTEGNRVNNQSAYNTCLKAKKKGCKIVKQWDSTLDGKTRDSHAAVDGEIRELDEKFSNGLMFPSDPNGTAAEVVNCRCALLQRAKWALDDDELQTLKDRAEYFGLDKTANFKDFKEKYLFASKFITENEKITKNISFAVDNTILESRAYSDKFNAMTGNKEEKREFLRIAKEMLRHRSGQNGEDLYLYNTKTKQWVKSVSGTEAGKPEYTDDIINAIKKAVDGEIIAFHNHPASMPPSVDDINSAKYNGYGKGYTLCHNGNIFEYTAGERYIDVAIYNLYVEKYRSNGYNEYEAQLKAMQYLSKRYDFSINEVK